MHVYNPKTMMVAIFILFGNGAVFGQEDCSSPLILWDETSGDTLLDLNLYENDYNDFCGNHIPGPDVVFQLEAYDKRVDFAITNEGATAIDLMVLFTFWCDPGLSCNAPFYLTFSPGTPITFSPLISQPIFVIVDAPDSPPGELLLRFTYSIPTPVGESTWGKIKMFYR